MNDDQLDKEVKIQGTKYDRKRKLSDKTLEKISNMAKKNLTCSKIAKDLGISYTIVRYHMDEAWRKSFNAKRDGRHTGKDKITVKNRVAYKRMLVAEGKI